MQVVEITGGGGSAECLTPSQRPDPAAAAGQIRIRVRAAGVNRPDILQRLGRYPAPPGASDILGLEVAGEVDQVGDGVTRWSVGDRVCALLGGGGYAEFAVVDARHALPVPAGIDWVCVSPKAGADLVVEAGDELKLVFPQPGAEPEGYEHLAFDRFSLQPMDGPDVAANTAAAVAHCLAHPRWRLSLQTHKALGIR